MSIAYIVSLGSSIGFAVSFFMCILMISTVKWHGKLSLDSSIGVQKVHRNPTPRIGGLAIFVSFVIASLFTQDNVRNMMLLIAAAGFFAFLFGFLEDCTKKVSVRLRLIATFASAGVFIWLTGYRITQTGIPVIDEIFQIKAFSIFLTMFAIAGLANAVNITDGFNGMSLGSSIIMLTGFLAVSVTIRDWDYVTITLVTMAVLAGVLILNFPFGFIFIGDGGSYFTGFLLACLAVMLPERSPEVSPIMSLAILAYPVTETLTSILRRLRRKGDNPGKADRVHLHHLIHRTYARRLAKHMVSETLSNPLTGMMIWAFPVLSLVLVALLPSGNIYQMLNISIFVIVYTIAYRKVGGIQKLSARRRRKKASKS